MEAAANAKAAWLAQEQDCIVRRMTDHISSSDDSDLTDGSSSDDDASPSAYAYTKEYNCTGDRKGNGTVRKW